MNAENGASAPANPKHVVASYRDYAQAERAVDYLSDNKFPVQRSVIVGRGLDMVEQITGRLTYLSATGRGAAIGAVVGALFGWLFGLFGWIAPLVTELLLAFYGALFGAIAGAAIGALTGLAGHALSGGRRDFSSRPSFRAQSYDVLVDNDVADQASRLLGSEGAPGHGTYRVHY